jgi:hypothetical protein
MSHSRQTATIGGGELARAGANVLPRSKPRGVYQGLLDRDSDQEEHDHDDPDPHLVQVSEMPKLDEG